MKKNVIRLALSAMLLALWRPPRRNKPTKKIPRVGILSLNPASVQKDRVEAFREALRKLGYVEGQTQHRIPLWGQQIRTNAQARRRAGPPQRRCDSHYGKFGDPPCQRSNHCDSHCDDVGNDPVGSGFVASLARPGGNITGLTTVGRDLGDKRLELLKEIIPKLSRV